jgi:hypothetical protein
MMFLWKSEPILDTQVEVDQVSDFIHTIVIKTVRRYQRSEIDKVHIVNYLCSALV